MPTDACGYCLIPAGIYSCLRVPAKICGCLRIFAIGVLLRDAACVYLRVSADSCERLQEFAVCYLLVVARVVKSCSDKHWIALGIYIVRRRSLLP